MGTLNLVTSPAWSDLPGNTLRWTTDRSARARMDLSLVWFLFPAGDRVRCPKCSDVVGDYLCWVCVRVHPGGRGAGPTGYGMSRTCKCGWHLDLRFIASPAEERRA